MKKFFVIFIVFFALSFTSKIAYAAESDCYVPNMCDNYVVICDAYDYLIWDEIYCGISEE